MFDFIKKILGIKSEESKFIEKLMTHNEWEWHRDDLNEDFYTLDIYLDDGSIQKVILQRNTGIVCEYEGNSNLPSISLKTKGPLLNKEFYIFEYEDYKSLLNLYYKVVGLFTNYNPKEDYFSEEETKERLKMINNVL